MKIFNSVYDLIGKTPMVRLCNIEKAEGLNCTLLAKLEGFNPAGSAKDRVAYSMIKRAEVGGSLKQGGTVIEPTSGNTGIALASVCASKGYKCVIVMPDTMSKERILLIKAYGAEVLLTDGKLGMKGAIDKALEIQKNTPNSIVAGQFDNPANPKIHYETTGPEIYSDTDGEVDIFVASIGTGGTISGTGKYLKEQNSNIKVVGVEPSESPLITKGYASAHKIQGIGANFIPKNFDKSVCDEVLTTSSEVAYDYAQKLATKEGLLCGISSGATLSVAVELAKRPENQGKTIVALLTDSGERYLSVDGFIK